MSLCDPTRGEVLNNVGPLEVSWRQSGASYRFAKWTLKLYLRSLLLSEKMKSGLDEVSPHHFLKTFDFVGELGRFRAVSRNLNLNLSLNELLLSSPAVGF